MVQRRGGCGGGDGFLVDLRSLSANTRMADTRVACLLDARRCGLECRLRTSSVAWPCNDQRKLVGRSPTLGFAIEERSSAPLRWSMPTFDLERRRSDQFRRPDDSLARIEQRGRGAAEGRCPDVRFRILEGILLRLSPRSSRQNARGRYELAGVAATYLVERSESLAATDSARVAANDFGRGD